MYSQFAFLVQKIKRICIANGKNKKKLALPMQKIKKKKPCIANAKNKKKLALLMQKLKKLALPMKKIKNTRQIDD